MLVFPIMVELNCCKRGKPCKAWTVYCMAIYRKSLLTSGLDYGKSYIWHCVKLYFHGKPKTTILASVGFGGNKMKKIENIRLVLPSPIQPPAGICLFRSCYTLSRNFRWRSTSKGVCVCARVTVVWVPFELKMIGRDPMRTNSSKGTPSQANFSIRYNWGPHCGW